MFPEDEELKKTIDRLIGIINILSNDERQLSLSALDYQSMGLASKHQIEAAIDRAEELGFILNKYIRLLDEFTKIYLKEC